ncbi:FIP1[V]-like protein [Bidens hawaiensis]|uniref:FIP1[V]-like protein n=1 Tax=Bidens hawaiensis TaxID=980011 RepID=UPI00404ABE27
MEYDDEFGDLYTDVLQPFQPPPVQPPPPPPPVVPVARTVDLNDRIPSDDEEILYGSKSSGFLKLGGSDVNPDGNLNNIDESSVRVLESDVNNNNNNIKEDLMEENFGIEEAGEEEDGFLIPGLSASGVPGEGAGGGPEGGDEWDDSDSEDDLQIVLNDDTGPGMMGMDGGVGLGGEDDDDGDNMLIVTGDDPNHHLPMNEMQDWGEDGGQGVEGGERKDLMGGDAGKGDGGGAVMQKTGYGNLGYHPFHSQFKYVRPGAAPMPGAGPVAPGGAPGQVRPPGSMLSFAGRGRGEWHPAGMKNVPPNMQKSYVPGWNNNGAGRGLDFTLPSHKTIFEVDIDGFEEKPWRLQGIDVSDFFNFGMNEETWKDYCKQLEQHRLEATMQSKIRVYESGRTEQEYDPDLPPELAAAAGHDIPPENRNFVKSDVQIDLTKGSGSAHSRMQLPTGKAIQVETGFGERLPSIDTRPLRMRDSDAIIEIVLQRSPSPSPERESTQEVDVVEHVEDIKENQNENLEIEDEVGSEADRLDKPQTYNNGRKREASGRRGQFVGSVHEVAATGDRAPHNHIDRPMKRSAASRSPRLADNQNEESTESVDRKQSHSSSPVTHGSADDRSFDQNDAIKDAATAENANDKDAFKDEKAKHKMKKQKVFTQAEHSSVERGEDREDSIHSGGFRKPMKESRGRDERQERERHQMAMKWESNPNQGYRSHLKSENYDRKKVRESEGVWLDDMRKRSHKVRENERSDKNEHRPRKQLENGGWKGDYDRDTLPVLKTQPRHHIIPEGMQSKREDSLHSHRESSSRRKRERDDNMQREKVERPREREKDKSWLGHTRMKEDSRSSNKEYQFKETSWDLGRREKFENEPVSRHRGRDDVYAHEYNKINNDERMSSRHERGYKDMHGMQEKKHKETLKKGKEIDAVNHNSLSTSRRNREDHNSQKSDRVSSRGHHEQRAIDQNLITRKSSKKPREKETASSDDEQSKKGRSKLERWTSHKEIDFGLDTKETDPPTKLPEESIKPQETREKLKPVVEEKDEDAKPSEDKHMDTVEKLKKRSERFKLPMPSEKEALAIKKMENEPLPSAQPEARPEADVKPERPARKRRWTSG